MKIKYSKFGYSHVRCKGIIDLPFHVEEDYEIELKWDGDSSYHNVKWNQNRDKKDDLKFLDCRKDSASVLKETSKEEAMLCSMEYEGSDPMIIFNDSDDNETDLIIEARLMRPFYWLSIEFVDKLMSSLNLTCY